MMLAEPTKPLSVMYETELMPMLAIALRYAAPNVAEQVLLV
jgi:hypothetical protein